MPAEHGHFRLDREWQRYLARKLDLLSKEPHRCRVLSRPVGALARPLERVAAQVAREHPRLLSLDGGRFSLLPLGVSLDGEGRVRAGHGAGRSSSEVDDLRDRLAAHLEAVPAPQRAIDLVALAVQEDLVILDGSDPGADEVVLLHVCFPSRWDPGARRGASFAQLHGPVPQSASLLAASRNLVLAMVRKGPFERFVWSLTDSPDLDGHPRREVRGAGASGHAAAAPGKDGAPGKSGAPGKGGAPGRAGAPGKAGTSSLLHSLYFRAERQTTKALGDGFALFTIRIHVAPLLEKLVVPGRAELLAAAVRGMSDELLAYKGLRWGRDELVMELDEFAQATRDPLRDRP